VHVLIARRAVRVTVALSVLLASGFAAQGLTSQPTKAGVVCGGESCSVYLGAYIKLTGDDQGDNPGINIPPPPCWYSPVSGTYPGEGAPAGAAVPMDKFMHAASKASGTWSLADGGGGGGGGSFFGQFLGTANSVSGYPKYRNPAAGTWYGLDANGSVAGRACTGQRPWLSWVGQGALPPAPEVPPLTLALYALAHMYIPTLGFTLNPKNGPSYVTLPTFVKAGLGGWNTGQKFGGKPYQYVTAHLNGTGESATVWAVAGSLYLSAGTSSATTYEPCAPLGSTWSTQEMDNAGSNARIDCGVTYRAPSTGGAFQLSGYIPWRPTWAAVAGGLPQGGAVPGGDLYSRGGQGVNVAEIQSLNG
jgi:hypothetical protein